MFLSSFALLEALLILVGANGSLTSLGFTCPRLVTKDAAPLTPLPRPLATPPTPSAIPPVVFLNPLVKVFMIVLVLPQSLKIFL